MEFLVAGNELCQFHTIWSGDSWIRGFRGLGVAIARRCHLLDFLLAPEHSTVLVLGAAHMTSCCSPTTSICQNQSPRDERLLLSFVGSKALV